MRTYFTTRLNKRIFNLIILMLAFFTGQEILQAQALSPSLFSNFDMTNGKGNLNLPSANDAQKSAMVMFDLGPAVFDQGIGCSDGPLDITYYSEHYRKLILPGTDAVEFTQASVIVEGASAVGANLQVVISVHTGFPFPSGTFTEIASSAIIQSTMTGTNPIDIPLTPSGVAIPGDEVVIKIITPGNLGVAFRMGYGFDEGATTWLFAPECDVINITPFDDFDISSDIMLTLKANVAPAISQTDEDGDGTPDITDPCACGDPLNIIDGGGNITHFHDFVLVNSGPGETWQITALNSGAIFDNGLVAIPLGTTLPEISPGIYKLNLWHPVGVGFNVTVDRTAGGFPFPLMTGGTCNACPVLGIPAMGEWGLIVLALFLLSFATVSMMRRQTALVGAGNMATQSKGIPFDRSSFGKMLVYVMIGLAATFVLAVSVFGYEMTAVDLPGSLIAGPALAYLLHLLFSVKSHS